MVLSLKEEGHVALQIAKASLCFRMNQRQVKGQGECENYYRYLEEENRLCVRPDLQKRFSLNRRKYESDKITCF